MELRHLFILALGAAAACLTSCKKDNGPAAVTDMEEAAGKYIITDKTSPLQSVELTRSGEYIITRNKAESKASEDNADDIWLFGKFTVKDGLYTLNGFGELLIESLGNGKFNLNIDSNEPWDRVVVSATAASSVVKTELNRRLCRHWTFEKTHFNLKVNDFQYVDFELPGCNFSQWIEKTQDQDGSNGLDEKVEGLVFTENGSLVILYDNSKINVGSWQWSNNADGTLSCNWDTQYSSTFKDYRFNGNMTVGFTESQNGNADKCTIVRSYTSTYRKGLLGFIEKVTEVAVTLTYYMVAAE